MMTTQFARFLYKDRDEGFFNVFVDILFSLFLVVMILVSSVFMR